MSADRYVIKADAGKAVLGSQFTLTLVPSSVKDSKDENFNMKPVEQGYQPENASKARTGEGISKNGHADLDDKFFSLFKNVAGEDLEVDAFELQSVLGLIFKRDFGEVKDFSIECCRSLIVMADMDRSGKLDFGQFKDLFQWLMEKRKLYRSYENSQSWDMDSGDLKEVIEKLDYDVRTETINLLAIKYRNKKMRINFDDFLQICARIQACHDSYLSYQSVGDSFDEFVMHVIYT